MTGRREFGHITNTVKVKELRMKIGLPHSVRIMAEVVLEEKDVGVSEKITGGRKKKICIIRRFMICTPPLILLGYSNHGRFDGWGMWHA
jgi:hypothetical protein